MQEVSDFADFLLSKAHDEQLIGNLQKLMAEPETFKFLEEEPELYSVDDIKKKVYG